MRDPAETSFFTTVPTALVGEDAVVLYVKESEITDSTVRTLGMTLTAFMPLLPKEDAELRGYGSYVLTKAGELADGMRAFWFAKQRSPEEIATAFDSDEGLRQGIYWPPVLNTVVTANLLAYDANLETYVASIVWDFSWTRKAWRGPTKVKVEYFASHEPFEVTVPTAMQDEGDFFNYGIGSMTLPPCLHGYLDLYVDIPESSRHPAQTFERVMLATSLTNWPDTLVIDMDPSFDRGIYILKVTTAYKPY